MNYIVDDIGLVVAAMRSTPAVNADPKAAGFGAPYYMFGHVGNINNLLQRRGVDKVFKYQRYPLVALRLDIPEVKHDGVIDYTLNIAILAFTDKQYTDEQRYEHVFKPVLYPLYQLFLDKLRDSGLFMWDGWRDFPDHTKVDRPFYGTAGATLNQENIFDDPLDAIEILDLKISQTIKC